MHEVGGSSPPAPTIFDEGENDLEQTREFDESECSDLGEIFKNRRYENGFVKFAIQKNREGYGRRA